MSRRAIRAGRLAALLYLTLRPEYQSVQNVFRAQSQAVAIYATARDHDGRLRSNLTQNDFEILEDGKPTQITVFGNSPQPLTGALLLDMSNSIVREYFQVVAAAHEFVDQLDQSDRLRIGTFGREVALSPLLTNDKQALHRILDDEVWPTGATPLWRAVSVALASLKLEQGRRVVVVVTDGADSGGDYNCASLSRDPHGNVGPCADSESVRKEAVRDGTMIYGIGLPETGLDLGLLRVAQETGGGHATVRSGETLSSTLAALLQELRHQYVLGFSPRVLDGKTHKIEVRTKDKAFRTEARRSYLAEVNR